jgi:uncharacterized protein RhaS with RHS repeats
MGRWISRDPIGEADDLNLYAAMGNDPVSKFDPDGRAVHYAFTSVDWKYYFSPILWANSWFKVGSTRNVAQIDSRDCCHLDYRGFTDYSTPEYSDKYAGTLARIRHSFATAASAAISTKACLCRGKAMDGLELTVYHIYRSRETVSLQLSGGLDVGIGNEETGNITGKIGVTVTIPPASDQSSFIFKYLVCPSGDAGNVPVLRLIGGTPLLQQSHGVNKTLGPYWTALIGWVPPLPPNN